MPRSRLLPCSLALLALAACGEPTSPDSQARFRDGVMEVTISGIGSPSQSARASLAGAAADGPRRALTAPGNAGGGGGGGIQMQVLSTGSFTSGTRGAGGVRYVWASFRVRNANQNGVAFDTPRQNLTFVAASTGSTLQESAIAQMLRFDGSAASAAIAPTVMPTGAVPPSPHDGAVQSDVPDVLQVMTEPEAAAVPAPPSVTSVFPYGFVVRRDGDNTTRTLPASPAEGQFDGVVTFAYVVPLQATAAEDPFTVTAAFLVRDDDETRITQSLQEQNAAGNAAFEARATALGATTLTLLPGNTYAGAGTTRLVCQVRTAGTAAAPTAFLVDACPPPP